MTDDRRPTIKERKDAVRRRLTLSKVVADGGVLLSVGDGKPKRRGKCPFHGSNSPSFALFDANTGDGRAHCFGCQWDGDIFEFHRDIRGIDFIAALEELEQMAGIATGGERVAGSGPIHVERAPRPPRKKDGRELIDSLDMARAVWRRARPDAVAVRRYFVGRGVPEGALTDARIASFRYLGECPCVPWWLEPGEGDPGRKRWPRETLVAPAIMAMVRVPFVNKAGGVDFVPTGLHVTYLNPEGTGTMVRRKPWAKVGDDDPMLPKRRMLGPVGRGAILLGDYRPDAELFVGEGNETVLSAIGLVDAAPETVGVATLSLDNLQGRPKLWKGGIWPLHAIEPDPERMPFVIPGHRGEIIGLVDSDMSPLRGMRDQRTGEFLGEPVVERKGGPIIRRAITGAERARICGELVVKGWRAAGVNQVGAVRAPAGMDFNDAARERAREVA